MKYKFKCQQCGSGDIEQVLIGCDVCQLVEFFDGGEPRLYVAHDILGGKLSHFQCFQCGEIVRDENGSIIDTTENLHAWFERGMPRSAFGVGKGRLSLIK